MRYLRLRDGAIYACNTTFLIRYLSDVRTDTTMSKTWSFAHKCFRHVTPVYLLDLSVLYVCNVYMLPADNYAHAMIGHNNSE